MSTLRTPVAYGYRLERSGLPWAAQVSVMTATGPLAVWLQLVGPDGKPVRDGIPFLKLDA